MFSSAHCFPSVLAFHCNFSIFEKARIPQRQKLHRSSRIAGAFAVEKSCNMIVYKNSKGGFISDVRDNLIAYRIQESFDRLNIGHGNEAEFRAWSNSLQYMRNAIDDDDISNDCEIAIEYKIPLTSKRVDFIIAGQDSLGNNNVVVVELKQWETSGITSRPDIVTAFTGGAVRAVTHPSYQAYSYAKIIECFNEEVAKHSISLYPCAFLHNYKEENRSNIDCEQYKTAIELAPVFLGQDTAKLRNFIKSYIRKKDEVDLLMMVENGKLKPAKALQDCLASMLAGNPEFVLIDEQKVAYETVKKLVENRLGRSSDQKYTVIIEGGPGTGKSVVAITLLCELIKKGYSSAYVTKNAAPRNVYFHKLRGNNLNATYINSLFKGSGSFVNSPKDVFDCLIADEAHRLQMKSGIYQNLGEAQIKEIIHASKVSVFLIDEDQVVTTSDVGSVDLIKRYAAQEGSQVIHGSEFNLPSQFRCNGSDGYLAFLDRLLGIRQTANESFDLDYDIQVFDDPCKMRELLREKNKINNKARMVAGYCYNWVSKNDLSRIDIALPGGFEAQWNFANTNTFAIDENSFEQVGCIHTTQGLEFDYVGVIIGKDLICRDGKVLTDYTQRARTDKSLSGIKSSGNYALADRIIRNTYKTLLTRGQKGCYVYCEDEELREYIKSAI